MPLMQYFVDLSEKERETFLKDLKNECALSGVTPELSTPEEVVDTVVELAISSKADRVIIPVQDLLRLGKEARMNLPSTLSTDNWSFRIKDGELTTTLFNRLAGLNKKYKRS